jgi:hypothetical protein
MILTFEIIFKVFPNVLMHDFFPQKRPLT